MTKRVTRVIAILILSALIFSPDYTLAQIPQGLKKSVVEEVRQIRYFDLDGPLPTGSCVETGHAFFEKFDTSLGELLGIKATTVASEADASFTITNNGGTSINITCTYRNSVSITNGFLFDHASSYNNLSGPTLLGSGQSHTCADRLAPALKEKVYTNSATLDYFSANDFNVGILYGIYFVGHGGSPGASILANNCDVTAALELIYYYRPY